MNYSLMPISQNESWNQLLSLKNKIPQSLLCIGPSGVGKKRSIQALFQVINCLKLNKDEEPCGTCVQCKKIYESNHSDIITITAKGEQILVDDLREMKKTTYFAPIESKVRFIIIDEAHRLNSNSANSILKLLEEPPAHTRFFLITHERNLILPTILSRSQFIYFAPLSNIAIKELLLKMELTIPPKYETIILELLSGGLSRAQWLLQDEQLAFIDKITTLNRNPDLIASFSEQVAGDNDKIQLMIDYLLIQKHKNKENLNSNDWIKLNDLFNYQIRLNRNANKKLISYLITELYT